MIGQQPLVQYGAYPHVNAVNIERRAWRSKVFTSPEAVKLPASTRRPPEPDEGAEGPWSVRDRCEYRPVRQEDLLLKENLSLLKPLFKLEASQCCRP